MTSRAATQAKKGVALKAGVWYVISSIMVKAVSIITTPIFTRMLTHAEFGAFNNYTAWVSIVTVFVTLNLDSTLISARYDHEQDFDGYILSMLARFASCSMERAKATSSYRMPSPSSW